jgi:putative ABC transport system permease protein
MTVRELFLREIGFRKTAFGLALLSAVVAMTAWIAAIALLRAQELRTDELLIAKQRETQLEMQRMEDDYRRIMRDLGYNVMVLAEEQSLPSLRAKGYPEVTMPFETARLLADGGITTLNHLHPILQQQVRWPENGHDIILSGTPGQIPIARQTQHLTPDGTAYRNPIMPVIPKDELIMGHSIAQSLGLKPGDETVLMGTPFRVARVNPPEGTTDDIAVWADLTWVQEQLGLPDRINAILALECVCAADDLGKIIEEVNRLSPGLQVLEFSSRVKARAQARNRAAEAHERALEAELAHRAELTGSQQQFASIMAPVVIGGSLLWLFLLFVGNVRERRVEIAILRAIGVPEGKILFLFLGKSVLIGVLAALTGFFFGSALAAFWSGLSPGSPAFWDVFHGSNLSFALLAGPALCVLAAWIPAIRAIRSDPAGILCEN